MKQKKSKLLLLFVFNAMVSSLLFSCNLWEKNTSQVRNFIVMSDTEPPVLQEVVSVNSKQVRLVFNEEVTPYQNSFDPNSTEAEGYSILVTLNQDVNAGTKIMLKGRVQDSVGNTSEIETPVWGFNPNLAKVRINEFSTRGEGNNPDRTELYVETPGSLTGAVLYNGIPSNWDSCVIFDELELKSGDYVVIWWTEELPELITSKSGVYNICAKTNVNLPGYNGILTLAESPAQGADVIDCVVYSNFSSTYEGFGSKTTLERVQKAVKNNWWQSLTNPIDSTNNTATRTMCRRSDGTWYVCETKGSTFGSENNTAEYTI